MRIILTAHAYRGIPRNGTIFAAYRCTRDYAEDLLARGFESDIQNPKLLAMLERSFRMPMPPGKIKIESGDTVVQVRFKYRERDSDELEFTLVYPVDSRALLTALELSADPVHRFKELINYD